MNFKEAFLSLLQKNHPVTKLPVIPFWHQAIEANDDLNQANCYISYNYFYGFSSPVPTEKILKSEEEKAKKEGAEYILIPNVRNDEESKILDDHHYQRLLAATESVVIIKSTLEEVFFSTSRKCYRENMRYKRMADEYYVIENYVNEYIDDDVIEVVSRLHEQHRVRHNNLINIFNDHVLKQMRANRGLSNLRILVRRNKKTMDSVQVSVLIEYPHEKTIHYQSQAIYRDVVPSSHNLYRAAFIDVYLHAMRSGYHYVNLGRGLTEYKKEKLAATLFYEQSHWFKKI